MMTRLVVLDTETTGHSTSAGHRIIEIGCLELVDRQLSGKQFHCYVNPDRDVDPGAQAVHGLSRDFLSQFDTFPSVVNDLLAFLSGAEVLIHNAPFDLGFLNYELALMRRQDRIEDVCSITDTLLMARQKHPGQRNSLDALCKRYGVDATRRRYHGALLDSELLAQVYLHMTCEQGSLFQGEALTRSSCVESAPLLERTPRYVHASDEELSAHHAMLQRMRHEFGACLWDDCVEPQEGS